MILLAAVLALNAADPAPPNIPPAVIDETLEVTGEDVAAEQRRTRLFVPVTINGQGPFRFLIDSGADRSVVGSSLAAALALPPGRGATLLSMAGPSKVTTVIVDRLTIGASEISGIVAPALPERFLGAQGLLGIDALAEQRLMLDFDKKLIVVEDARRPARSSPDEIVVTARRRNGQLILTEVVIAGARLYAVIDTGSEATIGNAALRARVFRGRAVASRPITLTSVTGATIVADLVVIPEMRIGGAILKNVPVAFAEVAPFALFGLAKNPAVLLGTDVLEAFRRVSLDFRARKVRFVLRR